MLILYKNVRFVLFTQSSNIDVSQIKVDCCLEIKWSRRSVKADLIGSAMSLPSACLFQLFITVSDLGLFAKHN